MAEYYTITEISKMTGLASHTIRYYEKQFPLLLDVGRSRGGHRLYQPKHLQALRKVVHLLKEKNLSIRATRKILGESEIPTQPTETAGTKSSGENYDLAKVMSMVLERLDQLCRSNERRDIMLETFLQRALPNDCSELLEQIDRCRNETRETMNLYQSLMVRWKNSN